MFILIWIRSLPEIYLREILEHVHKDIYIKMLTEVLCGVFWGEGLIEKIETFYVSQQPLKWMSKFIGTYMKKFPRYTVVLNGEK